MISWFDASDWLKDRNTVITIVVDGTNAFKALMYWWKLASTMHKEKHLFSTCSMTGKVARRVLSDWKCCTVRVQWRETCGILSDWWCTIHDEWLVFAERVHGVAVLYSACWVGENVQCMLNCWIFTVPAQWLEKSHGACSVTGNLQLVSSGWKYTERVQ